MGSSDKADGYLTEMPYVLKYHRELNPAIHALALTGQNISTPTPGAPFKYLELGCGFGLSSLIHAASNPAATFIAIDIMPAHIATARHIAAAAGLTNIEFIECAFADLEPRGLPTFDVITLHGVWSWINDENRTHILKIIDRHLAASGVLYMSYNALPGLAAALPLRQLMWTGFHRATGTPDVRVAAGVALAEQFRAAGATFFAANPRAGQILDDARTRAVNALAHEYFNADWWPFYHVQVADAVKPLGLRYAASASILDNMDVLNLSPAAQAQLANAADITELETLKDFFANREFRRDIFVREPARTSAPAPVLDTLRFVTAGGPAGIDRIVAKTQRGEIRPQKERALAILEALLMEPKSAVQLAQGPVGARLTQSEILETLLVLTALGAAEPALPDDDLPLRRARTRQLNVVLWEAAVASDAIHANASPVTGGGVAIERVEQLFLLARHRNEEPAAFVRRVFGAQVQGDIAANYAHFEAIRVPVLRKLGVL